MLNVMPFASRDLNTISETFQMRYYTKFYLKGHQKYKQSNFWLSKFTLGRIKIGTLGFSVFGLST